MKKLITICLLATMCMLDVQGQSETVVNNEVINTIMAQPWIIRVVENQELIASVTEVFKAKNPDMVNRDPSFKNMFRNAPNIICVCTPANVRGEIDAGSLGENMMLAAIQTSNQRQSPVMKAR